MSIYLLPDKQRLSDKNYDPKVLMSTLNAVNVEYMLVMLLKKGAATRRNVYIWTQPSACYVDKVVVYGGHNKAREEVSLMNYK